MMARRAFLSTPVMGREMLCHGLLLKISNMGSERDYGGE